MCASCILPAQFLLNSCTIPACFPLPLPDAHCLGWAVQAGFSRDSLRMKLSACPGAWDMECYPVTLQGSLGKWRCCQALWFTASAPVHTARTMP